MIKHFLEEFKKPKEYRELGDGERGGMATVHVGVNDKGSKFYKKTEQSENIYRNYVMHEVFSYINSGAGKTIVPITKHYDVDAEFDRHKGKIQPIFTSSSFVNERNLSSIKNNKDAAIRDVINAKFMIPLMLIGGGDFHGGNKIMSLRKMAGYGIDFVSGPFGKSYVSHANRRSIERGKIPKKLERIRYASKSDGNDRDEYDKEKLHRYYQMLFFYHNFFNNNKRNFKKIFDDAQNKLIRLIQREYLANKDLVSYGTLKEMKTSMDSQISQVKHVHDKEYPIFIRNMIKVIEWTKDQMNQIDKIMERKDD